ncbi:MAG: hypothetical protein LBQ79_09775 [Deltaproteobacteria bacterium]|jgi:zinc transporter ZupT|nr:hypothetical protein [Deltaproteobacteria bacterium]
MTKKLMSAALAFAVGTATAESGILSVLVSFAYSAADGSSVPFLAGVLLTMLGLYLVVHSTRIIRRREEKSRPFFE